MPTYQYRCTECGEQLEVVQKFSDDPLTECPACHGRLRKLFSPVGVVFKGSGFYKTDSRSSSSSASKSDSKESSAAAGGDGAAKSSDSASPAKTGGESSSASTSSPTGDKVA